MGSGFFAFRDAVAGRAAARPTAASLGGGQTQVGFVRRTFARTIEKGDTPMKMQHTVRGERAGPPTGAPRRSDRSLASPAAVTTLCPYCGYHPASTRIFGYCSWDCHDADDDEEGEQAA